jgi:hypothetical protein
LGLDNALDIGLIKDLLSESDKILYPQYKYEDALKYQPDPLHSNLIGYIAIIHNVAPDAYEKFSNLTVVKDHFVQASRTV